jgi:hypothetical protein
VAFCDTLASLLHSHNKLYSSCPVTQNPEKYLSIYPTV